MSEISLDELSGDIGLDEDGLLHRLMQAKVIQLQMIQDRGFVVETPLQAAKPAGRSQTVKFTYNNDLLQVEQYLAERQDEDPEIVAASFRQVLKLDIRPNFNTLLSGMSRVYRGDPDNNFNRQWTPTQTLAVIYFFEKTSGGTEKKKEKIHKESLQELTREINAVHMSLGTDQFIIVTQDSLHEDIQRKMMEIPDKDIWVFGIGQLQVNITKHAWVPRHSLCSPELTRTIFSQVNPSKLPRMISTDPVAFYYGFRPGMLIRIERHAIEITSWVLDSIAYRLVDKPPPILGGRRRF